MKKLLDYGEYRLADQTKTLSSVTGVRYLHFSTNEYDFGLREDYITDGQNLFLLSESGSIYSDPIALPKSNLYIYATRPQGGSFSIHTWSPVDGRVELADDVIQAIVCLDPEAVFILHADGTIYIDGKKNLPFITGCSSFAVSANGSYVLANKAGQMVICDVKGTQRIVNIESASHSLPSFISDDGNILIWGDSLNEHMIYIHDVRRSDARKLTFEIKKEASLYVTRDGKKLWLRQTKSPGHKELINTFYDTDSSLHHVTQTQEDPVFGRQLIRQFEEYKKSYFEHLDSCVYVCDEFADRQSEFYFAAQIPDEHDEFFFDGIFYRNADGSDVEIATGGGEDGCSPELYRFDHKGKECLAVCGDWGGLKICYEENGFCRIVELNNIPHYLWGSCCYDDGKLAVFQQTNNEYSPHGIIQGAVWFFDPLNTRDSGRQIVTTQIKDGYRLHLKNDILLVTTDAYLAKEEDGIRGWCVSISVFHLKTGKTQVLENVRAHYGQEADGSFYYLLATSKPEYCDLWYYPNTGVPCFLGHNVSEDQANRFCQSGAGPTLIPSALRQYDPDWRSYRTDEVVESLFRQAGERNPETTELLQKLHQQGGCSPKALTLLDTLGLGIDPYDISPEGCLRRLLLDIKTIPAEKAPICFDLVELLNRDNEPTPVLAGLCAHTYRELTSLLPLQQARQCVLQLEKLEEFARKAMHDSVDLHLSWALEQYRREVTYKLISSRPSWSQEEHLREAIRLVIRKAKRMDKSDNSELAKMLEKIRVWEKTNIRRYYARALCVWLRRAPEEEQEAFMLKMDELLDDHPNSTVCMQSYAVSVARWLCSKGAWTDDEPPDESMLTACTSPTMDYPEILEFYLAVRGAKQRAVSSTQSQIQALEEWRLLNKQIREKQFRTIVPKSFITATAQAAVDATWRCFLSLGSFRSSDDLQNFDTMCSCSLNRLTEDKGVLPYIGDDPRVPAMRRVVKGLVGSFVEPEFYEQDSGGLPYGLDEVYALSLLLNTMRTRGNGYWIFRGIDVHSSNFYHTIATAEKLYRSNPDSVYTALIYAFVVGKQECHENATEQFWELSAWCERYPQEIIFHWALGRVATIVLADISLEEATQIAVRFFELSSETKANERMAEVFAYNFGDLSATDGAPFRDQAYGELTQLRQLYPENPLIARFASIALGLRSRKLAMSALPDILKELDALMVTSGYCHPLRECCIRVLQNNAKELILPIVSYLFHAERYARKKDARGIELLADYIKTASDDQRQVLREHLNKMKEDILTNSVDFGIRDYKRACIRYWPALSLLAAETWPDEEIRDWAAEDGI